jgi:hypothetical protein
MPKGRAWRWPLYSASAYMGRIPTRRLELTVMTSPAKRPKGTVPHLRERWPGNFGQSDKWIFCLTAA